MLALLRHENECWLLGRSHLDLDQSCFLDSARHAVICLHLCTLMSISISLDCEKQNMSVKHSVSWWFRIMCVAQQNTTTTIFKYIWKHLLDYGLITATKKQTKKDTNMVKLRSSEFRSSASRLATRPTVGSCWCAPLELDDMPEWLVVYLPLWRILVS